MTTTDQPVYTHDGPIVSRRRTTGEYRPIGTMNDEHLASYVAAVLNASAADGRTAAADAFANVDPNLLDPRPRPRDPLCTMTPDCECDDCYAPRGCESCAPYGGCEDPPQPAPAAGSGDQS